MAGENPAQSVALVGQAGKLFGLQLNDAHVKLGAEDGLAFGAVNPTMALELVRWIQRVGYDGHIYFDTFPRWVVAAGGWAGGRGSGGEGSSWRAQQAWPSARGA